MGSQVLPPAGRAAQLPSQPVWLLQPCPCCPLVARGTVWGEAAAEGLRGEHPQPCRARVSVTALGNSQDKPRHRCEATWRGACPCAAVFI